MGLTTHLKARAALLFLGFFAGAILNMNLPLSVTTGPLQGFLFFVLPFGGAYLLQFAFARLRPAACPRCGGPDSPKDGP